MKRKLILIIGTLAVSVGLLVGFATAMAASGGADLSFPCMIGGGSGPDGNFSIAAVDGDVRVRKSETDPVIVFCSGDIIAPHPSQTVAQVGSTATFRGNPQTVVVNDPRHCYSGLGGIGLLAGPAVNGASSKTNNWTQTINPDGSVQLKCFFVP